MTTCSHRRLSRLAAAVLGSTLAALASPGSASPYGAVYKDAERYGLGIDHGRKQYPPDVVGPRPRRLVSGGRGYVGSSWGLGRPSYSGIGTRPDWGDVEQ